MFCLGSEVRLSKDSPKIPRWEGRRALPWYVVVVVGIAGSNAGVKALHGKERHIYWTRVVEIGVLFGALDLWTLP